MNTGAVATSAGSVVWVMGSIVLYLRTIPRDKVPVKVTGFALQLLFGIGLAGAAIAWGVQTESAGAAVIAPAAFAAVMALMLLGLLTQRKTPIGDIKLKVGDKLLAFEATTSEGTRFHTDDLAGKRTLLKFFRGGW